MRVNVEQIIERDKDKFNCPEKLLSLLNSKEVNVLDILKLNELEYDDCLREDITWLKIIIKDLINDTI